MTVADVQLVIVDPSILIVLCAFGRLGCRAASGGIGRRSRTSWFVDCMIGRCARRHVKRILSSSVSGAALSAGVARAAAPRRQVYEASQATRELIDKDGGLTDGVGCVQQGGMGGDLGTFWDSSLWGALRRSTRGGRESGPKARRGRRHKIRGRIRPYRARSSTRLGAIGAFRCGGAGFREDPARRPCWRAGVDPPSTQPPRDAPWRLRPLAEWRMPWLGARSGSAPLG